MKFQAVASQTHPYLAAITINPEDVAGFASGWGIHPTHRCNVPTHHRPLDLVAPASRL
jgi:hypothetical protein